MGVVENIDNGLSPAGRSCTVYKRAPGVFSSDSISSIPRFSAPAISIVLEVYLWQRFEEAA
jgi:hypothetical protein